MKLLIFIMAFLLIAPAMAQNSGGDAPYANQQLDDPAKEAAAHGLMMALRCIQCQGQSIADSDAPIAGAMRSEVRQRILAGEKPGVIREWLIARYGQWVSFEPPAQGAGLILWFAPLLILLSALWLVRGLFGWGKA